MVRSNPYGVPKPANGFFMLTMVFGVLFAVTTAAAASAILPTVGFEDPRDGDAELMLLDTSTGKLKDMKKTVPNEDIDSFRMDMNNDIATWYSKGEFKSYDVGSKTMKDNYMPSNHYDPYSDPFTTNGEHMAFYSSWTNSVVVRENVPTDGSDPANVKEIPSAPDAGQARLMTTDAEDFYWVSDDLMSTGSVVYRYDTDADRTDMVFSTSEPVVDMDAHNGRVAYEMEDYSAGTTHVKVFETDTGTEYKHCSDCSMPSMGGSLLAVKVQGGLMVSNMDTGGDKYIEENNEVLDVETDGDKVAWSWIPPYHTDPITVKDMATGDEKTYQPEKLIFGFAMDDNNIILLQSKMNLPNTVGPDPAAITALALSPLFLLATMAMGGITLLLEGRRKSYIDRLRRWQYWQQYGYYYGGGYYGYGQTYQPYYYPTYNYGNQGNVSNYSAGGTPRYY